MELNGPQTTHLLALFGGGAKKDGGDGMLGGIQFIYNTGLNNGAQYILNGGDPSQLPQPNFLTLKEFNNDD